MAHVSRSRFTLTNQKEREREKRNKTVIITQKELTLNNEIDFKMYTNINTYEEWPGCIEMPQALILEVS